MSYISFFHMVDSSANVVENAMFKKPTNFDDRLAEVTKRIEELNMKAKGGSFTPGTFAAPGQGEMREYNYMDQV